MTFAVVYKSNIYNLATKIVKEYGENWNDMDIDLPWLITKDNKDEIYEGINIHYVKYKNKIPLFILSFINYYINNYKYSQI